MQLLNCHLPDICSMDYYIYSFFSFAFDAKETKDQGKKNAPPFFRASAQRLRLFEMTLLVLQWVVQYSTS